MTLTDKQQAFVREYSKDWNASAAYLRAGYSGTKGYHVNALRLLRKDYIKAAIEQEKAKQAEKIDVTVEYVIQAILDGLRLAKEKGNLGALAQFTNQLARYKGLFSENVGKGGIVPQIRVYLPDGSEVRQPQAERPNLRLHGAG